MFVLAYLYIYIYIACTLLITFYGTSIYLSIIAYYKNVHIVYKLNTIYA